MDTTITEIESLTEVANKQERTFSVLSSIENSKMNKFQNILPNTTTKRYSIPKDMKDSFYAIHHHTEIPKKRARKREAADLQRKKYRHQSKTSLFQTCNQLWPTESMDFSYDYIKSLSDLLKIRLTQAKFKLLSNLNQDNDLCSYLKTPEQKSRHKIRIYQLNKPSMAVIGNSKNLFNRMYKLQKRLLLPPIGDITIPSSSSSNKHIPKPASKKSTSSKKPKERKKKPSQPKIKRITTPKRRSIAADIMPTTLEDGSKMFLCEPCNKKYKNRNGLAYHMQRCKGTKPVKAENNSSSDEQTTVRCEKCGNWSHSENTPEANNSLFYCSDCKQESSQIEEKLLQCLLDTDASKSPASSDKDAMDVDYSQDSPASNDAKDADVWDDFDMDKWNDESSTWNMSDLNILPPSLLFSDNNTSPLEPTPSSQDWFQFANLQDDYEP